MLWSEPPGPPKHGLVRALGGHPPSATHTTSGSDLTFVGWDRNSCARATNSHVGSWPQPHRLHPVALGKPEPPQTSGAATGS